MHARNDPYKYQTCDDYIATNNLLAGVAATSGRCGVRNGTLVQGLDRRVRACARNNAQKLCRCTAHGACMRLCTRSALNYIVNSSGGTYASEHVRCTQALLANLARRNPV